LPECAEDTREYGLTVGTSLVAADVFSDDNWRSNGSFGMTVVKRDALLAMELQQIVLAAPEPFDQPP